VITVWVPLSLLLGACYRRCVHDPVWHVITTATFETVEVVCCFVAELTVPIHLSTRIFMWKAYLFPVRCHDLHFMHEDIFRRCKTRCASNLILYRSYKPSQGWRSRACFDGKLDSENFDVISRSRENPLGWSSIEVQIVFLLRLLFYREFYLKGRRILLIAKNNYLKNLFIAQMCVCTRRQFIYKPISLIRRNCNILHIYLCNS